MSQSCPVGNCPVRLVSKRFVLRLPVFVILTAFLGLGWSSYAFVSLQTGAAPLNWSNPNVAFVINDVADPEISDETDVTAVRLAFQRWDEVSSSSISFFEDSNAGQRARADWRSDDIHMVLWDTTNESQFFGPGSGLVAITPVDFNTLTGQILDADILFNAKDHTFSTSFEAGRFDIQSIATHEVGHFIGLDHSGVVASTMNPFANTRDTRLRSLAQDDLAAAMTIYPQSGPPGEISGVVQRNGNPVSGAHVVAENRDGEAASATLSDGSGNFRIRGLDQGEYVVYAEPLDGPVNDRNFSTHTSHLVINTDFGTTFWGSGGSSSPENPQTAMVNFGQTTNVGAIATLPATNLNITSVTRLEVNPNTEVLFTIRGLSINSANRVVIPGAVGDGLFSTSPLPQDFTSSSVTVQLTVLNSALPQLRTVRVFNSSTNACAVLTGGFEVRLPRPSIASVAPSGGSPGDPVQPGDALTITGTEFQIGARAIVGSTVVNVSGSGTSVSLTVPDLPNGSYAVALENPDGQFDKQAGGLTVAGSTATAPPPPPTSSGGTSSGATPNTAQPASLPAGGGGGGGGGGCTLEPSPERTPLSGALLLVLAASLLVLRRRA